jgi:hypothetical protein
MFVFALSTHAQQRHRKVVRLVNPRSIRSLPSATVYAEIVISVSSADTTRIQADRVGQSFKPAPPIRGSRPPGFWAWITTILSMARFPGAERQVGPHSSTKL